MWMLERTRSVLVERIEPWHPEANIKTFRLVHALGVKVEIVLEERNTKDLAFNTENPILYW
jgi:hypothetical protein